MGCCFICAHITALVPGTKICSYCKSKPNDDRKARWGYLGGDWQNWEELPDGGRTRTEAAVWE